MFSTHTHSRSNFVAFVAVSKSVKSVFPWRYEKRMRASGQLHASPDSSNNRFKDSIDAWFDRQYTLLVQIDNRSTLKRHDPDESMLQSSSKSKRSSIWTLICLNLVSWLARECHLLHRTSVSCIFFFFCCCCQSCFWCYCYSAGCCVPFFYNITSKPVDI